MARARSLARSASGSGAADFADALAIYRGDLLPQDGPAEWAVERREHFRREAVEAATVVAEDAFAADDLSRPSASAGAASSSIDSTIRCGECSSRRVIRRVTGRGEPRSARVRLDPGGPRPQPGAGSDLRLAPGRASAPYERRHHGPFDGGGSGASTRLVPHFMQNRRAGLFAVLQFGQILGGTTSPWASGLPHLRQNLRVGLFGVPQFSQIRIAPGAGSAGPGCMAPGTTSSSVEPARRFRRRPRWPAASCPGRSSTGAPGRCRRSPCSAVGLARRPDRGGPLRLAGRPSSLDFRQPEGFPVGGSLFGRQPLRFEPLRFEPLRFDPFRFDPFSFGLFGRRAAPLRAAPLRAAPLRPVPLRPVQLRPALRPVARLQPARLPGVPLQHALPPPARPRPPQRRAAQPQPARQHGVRPRPAQLPGAVLQRPPRDAPPRPPPPRAARPRPAPPRDARLSACSAASRSAATRSASIRSASACPPRAAPPRPAQLQPAPPRPAQLHPLGLLAIRSASACCRREPLRLRLLGGLPFGFGLLGGEPFSGGLLGHDPFGVRPRPRPCSPPPARLLRRSTSAFSAAACSAASAFSLRLLRCGGVARPQPLRGGLLGGQPLRLGLFARGVARRRAAPRRPSPRPAAPPRPSRRGSLRRPLLRLEPFRRRSLGGSRSAAAFSAAEPLRLGLLGRPASSRRPAAPPRPSRRPAAPPRPSRRPAAPPRPSRLRPSPSGSEPLRLGLLGGGLRFGSCLLRREPLRLALLGGLRLGRLGRGFLQPRFLRRGLRVRGGFRIRRGLRFGR